jgi:hypothetical protein
MQCVRTWTVLGGGGVIALHICFSFSLKSTMIYPSLFKSSSSIRTDYLSLDSDIHSSTARLQCPSVALHILLVSPCLRVSPKIPATLTQLGCQTALQSTTLPFETIAQCCQTAVTLGVQTRYSELAGGIAPRGSRLCSGTPVKWLSRIYYEPTDLSASDPEPWKQHGTKDICLRWSGNPLGDSPSTVQQFRESACNAVSTATLEFRDCQGDAVWVLVVVATPRLPRLRTCFIISDQLLTQEEFTRISFAHLSPYISGRNLISARMSDNDSPLHCRRS